MVISVGFVISLPFTLTMFRWTLLLDFSVKSCRILFHIKVVLLRFLTINNLKYSFLYLRIEKVTLISQFSKFVVISFFCWVSMLQAQCFRNNWSLFYIRCLISLFIHGFECKVLSFLVTLMAYVTVNYFTKSFVKNVKYISLISLPFFKISLFQSILRKYSFDFLLWKFLLYTLVLGGGFGVMKSSRITNWIKWSDVECVMLSSGQRLNARVWGRGKLIKLWCISYLMKKNLNYTKI